MSENNEEVEKILKSLNEEENPCLEISPDVKVCVIRGNELHREIYLINKKEKPPNFIIRYYDIVDLINDLVDMGLGNKVDEVIKFINEKRKVEKDLMKNLIGSLIKGIAEIEDIT